MITIFKKVRFLLLFGLFASFVPAFCSSPCESQEMGSPKSPSLRISQEEIDARIKASREAREVRASRDKPVTILPPIHKISNEILPEILSSIRRQHYWTLQAAATFLYQKESHYCRQAGLYALTEYFEKQIACGCIEEAEKTEEKIKKIINFPGSVNNRRQIEALRGELVRRGVHFSLLEIRN